LADPISLTRLKVRVERENYPCTFLVVN